ncbi:N-formylglutamate amidohydrolase [Asticcacaulis sp. 201]|uniref:N-formylglutamate amidohydrolase n=1 Tax=Asticcacaulis sp. 201 TaxID=3028787 RepID=UPI002916A87B|nr:N-formylglutamate amidohydrolase [Asticcacaulis sp. 201]MDV6332026.1 N-formylglutamate amidohydrolase [Asticcacaulis sp. 201]
MTDLSPPPWHLVHTADLACHMVAPAGGASRVVYSLPHSGRYYPDSFVAEARQSPLGLRASEDAFVDELVDLRPELGVHGIACRYARAFCDVNRSPLELDARLIRGELPKAALSLSARVKAGFGVIARRLNADQDIYSHPLDMVEVNRRLDLIHRPYHTALKRLLAEAKRAGSPAILIDWHSMPSAALSHFKAGEPRPDIVLGNRHSETCSPDLVRRVRGVLEGAGLRVGLNKPFAGGYIVETYGRPAGGVEALQIEINRAIYMDEVRVEPLGGGLRLKGVFKDLTAELTRA